MAIAVVIATVVLLAPDARSESGPCAGGLRFAGSPDLVHALREELSIPVRPGAVCNDVIIKRDGSGLRLTLRRGGREVSRDVQDVRMAAVWLTTWLVPGSPTARESVADTALAADPPKAELTASSSPPSDPQRARAHTWAIGLDGRLGLDEEGGTLGGVDLSVAGAVTDHVCLGGALGLIWADDDGDEIPWEDVHASLRGGGFTDFYDLRLRGLLGLGLFTGAVGRDGNKTLDSGYFGELVLEASYPLSPSWSLASGLGARMSFSSRLNRWNSEGNEVVEIPELAVSWNFGVAYAFGGRE